MPNPYQVPPAILTDGATCKFCGEVLDQLDDIAKHELLCRIVKNLDPTGKPMKEYRKKVVKPAGETFFTGGSKDDPYDLSAKLALFGDEGSEEIKAGEIQKEKKKEKKAAKKEKKKEKKNKRKEEMKNQKDDKGKGILGAEDKKNKGKGILVAEDKKNKGKGILVAEEKKHKGKEIMLVELENEKEESENVEANKMKIQIFSEFAKTSPENALAILSCFNFDLNEALLSYTMSQKKE